MEVKSGKSAETAEIRLAKWVGVPSRGYRLGWGRTDYGYRLGWG
jgi:hypothetical protein